MIKIPLSFTFFYSLISLPTTLRPCSRKARTQPATQKSCAALRSMPMEDASCHPTPPPRSRCLLALPRGSLTCAILAYFVVSLPHAGAAQSSGLAHAVAQSDLRISSHRRSSLVNTDLYPGQIGYRCAGPTKAPRSRVKLLFSALSPSRFSSQRILWSFIDEAV